MRSSASVQGSSDKHREINVRWVQAMNTFIATSAKKFYFTEFLNFHTECNNERDEIERDGEREKRRVGRLN